MSGAGTRGMAVPRSWTNRTRRLGFAALLFFTAKGLLRLAVPVVFYRAV